MEHTCLILQPNMSGVACHELLHALGNLHEQSRSDARNFVILRRQNSQSDISHGAENFGFGYDFGSVLHYAFEFILNKNAGDQQQNVKPGFEQLSANKDYVESSDQYDLITLPRFYQQTIGQRGRISFKDAAIINQIYCKDSRKRHEDKCQNGGYLNPNDCTKCHCPDGYGGQYCDALEENENCNILADESRELKADQTAKVLKPVFGCTSADKECRCHWRITANFILLLKRIIKPMPGTKVRIQFKSLNNSLICSHPCTPPYVEIKYRTDKRAQGAKLCCPRALTDLDGNEYKNWIAAEKPDLDIVISAHLSPKWTVPSTKAEGGTVSFWGYSNPETKEIIRVDEIHCLTYKAAGVTPPSPKQFKSLQVEEQPPMKLSPSPLLANNASSLVHVFVPIVGHP
ncbi:hypothetical protein niasHS_011775 [Heterodera schachtii]|uniref:Metalloendopeptidase n=1 Tax=Heterodera schachtii TaxID=97005 RepID=A0ABD2IAQ1_HETSC